MVKRSRLRKKVGRKKPVRLKKVYAKEVYSIELGYTIDRTKQPHPLGMFDTDFKDPKAENPRAREWTYGGSRKNIEDARKDAGNLRGLTPTIKTRIVRSDTGEVLE